MSARAGYSGAQVFTARHRLARHKRALLRHFEDIDVLVTPTTPTTLTVAELEADNIALNAVMGTCTNFVNLPGMCAISVPSGFRADGLPQGLMSIAPALQEDTILAFAAAWQRVSCLPLGAHGNHCPD